MKGFARRKQQRHPSKSRRVTRMSQYIKHLQQHIPAWLQKSDLWFKQNINITFAFKNKAAGLFLTLSPTFDSVSHKTVPAVHTRLCL